MKALVQSRHMRKLQSPKLFPAVAAYQAITSRMSIVLAGDNDDGIDRIVHSEDWVTPDICKKEETWSLAGAMGPGWGGPIRMEAYYAKDGSYIGDQKTANYLRERGIAPQRAAPDCNVASIGFSEKDQVWWGWSHRAMSKFGVGDVFYRAGQATPYGNNDNENQDNPKRLIKDLDEAKACAIAFADDVS